MNKHEVYVVGGAVRNTLMGVPVKDMDYVVVGATPEEMLADGFEQVGADFPVFLKNGDEYALARTERKSGKGYHGFTVDASPEVTLEEDLRRRDLTVNAMAIHVDEWDRFKRMVANPDSDEAQIWMKVVLVDPFGGQTDLANKIAQPCAFETFIEDPLRLLRAARFSATYGFVWSARLRRAASHIIKSNELQTLSQERFFAEIEKVLKDAPTADQVREFSLRLIQFKLFEAHFYFSDDTRGIVAKMALEQFDKTDHKSMGAKLNALCPQGVENAYANRFKFGGALVDQIDFTHSVLNTAAMMAAADADMPMGSANVLLMGVYESIRSGRTGITMEFIAEMAEDFEDVKLVLKWLPGVEQIYKTVCFDTVCKGVAGIEPKQYGGLIQQARLKAIQAL